MFDSIVAALNLSTLSIAVLGVAAVAVAPHVVVYGARVVLGSIDFAKAEHDWKYIFTGVAATMKTEADADRLEFTPIIPGRKPASYNKFDIDGWDDYAGEERDAGDRSWQRARDHDLSERVENEEDEYEASGTRSKDVPY